MFLSKLFFLKKGGGITMITLEKAQQALLASEKKAKELGIAVSTAIVDEHGTLIAFSRMDGAITISAALSQVKAYTSGTIGANTADMAPFAQSGKPYEGLHAVLGGTLTTIAGGIAVKMNNKLVGGVGVGGSMDVSQDAQCAVAAALVLGQ